MGSGLCPEILDTLYSGEMREWIDYRRWVWAPASVQRYWTLYSGEIREWIDYT